MRWMSRVTWTRYWLTSGCNRPSSIQLSAIVSRRMTRELYMAKSILSLSLDELERTAEFVHEVVAPTPQYAWPKLRKRAGCTVWVKHENHTPTSAFKVRGGLVYLDRLKRSAPAVRGVISATRGNHGQSIAFAAARTGVPA